MTPENSIGERATIMCADIINCEDLAFDPEQGNGLVVNFDEQITAFR